MDRSKKGKGVGIWTPLLFKIHVRRDLMSAERNFFETCWLKLRLNIQSQHNGLKLRLKF